MVNDHMTDVPDENKGGNCYEDCFNEQIQNRPTWLLIHAEVSGQGPLAGRRYGHAFLLKDRVVWDPTHGELDAYGYCAIGNIDMTESDIYKMMESVEAALEHSHYGPWTDRQQSRLHS